MKLRFLPLVAAATSLLALPAALRAEDAAKPKHEKGGAFAASDTNHDGKLDLVEFTGMNKEHPNPEAAKKRFEKLDTDKDGFLSKEELQAGRKKGEKHGDKPAKPEKEN